MPRYDGRSHRRPPSRRRLSNLLAVICTAAALAVAALWVRSHWVVERVVYSPRVSAQSGSTYHAYCEPGRLGLMLQFYDFPAATRDEFVATKR